MFRPFRSGRPWAPAGGLRRPVTVSPRCPRELGEEAFGVGPGAVREPLAVAAERTSGTLRRLAREAQAPLFGLVEFAEEEGLSRDDLAGGKRRFSTKLREPWSLPYT